MCIRDRYRDYAQACAVCVEPSTRVFRPCAENVRIYRQTYPIFRELYAANKRNFDSISQVFQVE